MRAQDDEHAEIGHIVGEYVPSGSASMYRYGHIHGNALKVGGCWGTVLVADPLADVNFCVLEVPREKYRVHL